MRIELKIALILFLLLLMMISGFWLRKLGRPLNSGVFNLHKITTVVMIVFAIITLVRFQKTMRVEGNEWILLGINAVFLLLGFITGSFLSFDKFARPLLIMVHRISAFLVLISGIMTLFVFAVGN